MKGFGSALVSRTKRLMAALRSATDRKTPRMSRLLVSLAKKVSTALSQDAEVGVKWKVQRGCRGQPFTHFAMFMGSVVIDDGMDRLSLRHPRFDGVEEADELLMAVSFHVLPDDGAIEDIEGSKTASWCRAVFSHASLCRRGPVSSASPAGCGRALNSPPIASERSSCRMRWSSR